MSKTGYRKVLAATATRSENVKGQDLLVRPWRESDVPWVTDSWRKNYQRGGALSRRVPGHIYADAWHELMSQVLPRAGVLVACHPEAPDVNFGWICAEVIDIGQGPALAVHYAYVKDRFAATRTKAEKLPVNPDGTRPDKSAFAGGHGIGRLLLRTVAEPEADAVESVRMTCHTPRGFGWMRRMADEGVIPHYPEYDPFILLTTLPRGWY